MPIPPNKECENCKRLRCPEFDPIAANIHTPDCRRMFCHCQPQESESKCVKCKGSEQEPCPSTDCLTGTCPPPKPCTNCTKESVKPDEWEEEADEIMSHKNCVSCTCCQRYLHKLKPLISKISQNSFQRGKESGFSEGEIAELREGISSPCLLSCCQNCTEASLRAFDTTLENIKARKQSDDQPKV